MTFMLDARAQFIHVSGNDEISIEICMELMQIKFIYFIVDDSIVAMLPAPSSVTLSLCIVCGGEKKISIHSYPVIIAVIIILLNKIFSNVVFHPLRSTLNRMRHSIHSMPARHSTKRLKRNKWIEHPNELVWTRQHAHQAYNKALLMRCMNKRRKKNSTQTHTINAYYVV